MAYFVKQASPKGMPLFSGTFPAVVKWRLKAQKQGLLQHSHYEIHGQETKKDKMEFACDFFADDVGEDLV